MKPPESEYLGFKSPITPFHALRNSVSLNFAILAFKYKVTIIGDATKMIKANVANSVSYYFFSDQLSSPK